MATAEESLGHLQNSEFLRTAGLAETASRVRYGNGGLEFQTGDANAYLASVIADFLRQRLLADNASFTFETVMSSPDKVALLKHAQDAGYRTYLYYIATEDPEINISRVRNRVRLGGHPVPEDKIISRYWRSLELLMSAVRFSNRAYLFDNSASNQSHTWLAEITNGNESEIKSDSIPGWFKRAVLDKIARS